MFSEIPNLCIISLYIILILLSLAMSTLENFTSIFGPINVGSSTSAYVPGLGMILGCSLMLQVISWSDQCMYLGTVSITALTSICLLCTLCLSVSFVVNTQ